MIRSEATPLLSVLLPCRDAAAYLPDAIRSLDSQTFRDFEVIAVNDGSADETGAILERWAARDPRVQVLQRPGEGLPAALQAAAEVSRGRTLARFDADDVAHPQRFSHQIRFLARRPDLAAAGTQVRYFPHDQVGWGARRYERWLNRLAEPEQIARDVFVECPIPHPTLVIRREPFETAGGYRSNGWPEDYDLVLRLHLMGARLANLPRVLHFWRERPDRISRVDARYSAEAFRRCKISYLRRSHLSGHDRVAIWGAGRIGKDFARSLSIEGIKVVAFFDIDAGRIGQDIEGIPVRDASEVTRHLKTYLLVAVGAQGARKLIRQELAGHGFREPEDYRCVA